MTVDPDPDRWAAAMVLARRRLLGLLVLNVAVLVMNLCLWGMQYYQRCPQ